jgi:hypothetical protein
MKKSTSKLVQLHANLVAFDSTRRFCGSRRATVNAGLVDESQLCAVQCPAGKRSQKGLPMFRSRKSVASASRGGSSFAHVKTHAHAPASQGGSVSGQRPHSRSTIFQQCFFLLAWKFATSQAPIGQRCASFALLDPKQRPRRTFKVLTAIGVLQNLHSMNQRIAASCAECGAV